MDEADEQGPPKADKQGPPKADQSRDAEATAKQLGSKVKALEEELETLKVREAPPRPSEEIEVDELRRTVDLFREELTRLKAPEATTFINLARRLFGLLLYIVAVALPTLIIRHIAFQKPDVEVLKEFSKQSMGLASLWVYYALPVVASLSASLLFVSAANRLQLGVLVLENIERLKAERSHNDLINLSSLSPTVIAASLAKVPKDMFESVLALLPSGSRKNQDRDDKGDESSKKKD